MDNKTKVSWGFKSNTEETLMMERIYKNFIKTNDRILFNRMVTLYEDSQAVREIWGYDPSKHYYRERFFKIEKVNKLTKTIITISKKYNIEKEDYNICPNDAPATRGLYFVGQTTFNPNTDEKFYWVKVGLAINLSERMKNYGTHNPALWKIDYKPMPKKEKSEIALKEHNYHKILKGISYGKAYDSSEWFRISKEMYVDMCNQGFDFFKNL